MEALPLLGLNGPAFSCQQNALILSTDLRVFPGLVASHLQDLIVFVLFSNILLF